MWDGFYWFIYFSTTYWLESNNLSSSWRPTKTRFCIAYYHLKRKKKKREGPFNKTSQPMWAANQFWICNMPSWTTLISASLAQLKETDCIGLSGVVYTSVWIGPKSSCLGFISLTSYVPFAVLVYCFWLMGCLKLDEVSKSGQDWGICTEKALDRRLLKKKERL